MLEQPSTFEHLLVLYGRRFPVRRGKLRIVDSLWRAAAGGRGSKRIASLRHGDFKMPCDLEEMLQRQFYFFGTYLLAEEVLRCWEEAATRAAVVFDVGANAGIFSLAALAAQPTATVHAFEPTPEIAAELRETAALNRLCQLHVHQMAIHRADGHAALRRFRGEAGTNEGMNFVTMDLGDSNAEIVPTTSLDSFCAKSGIARIDLLKLDIQGNEHMALAGASRLLGAGRIGTIFVELNWAKPGAGVCPATESIRMLDTAGYQFSKPCVPLQWQRSGEWMRTTNDVVARQASHAPPADQR